jgi:hypothetical protein
MRTIYACFALCLSAAAFCQVQTPGPDRILSDAARQLAAMPFDANAPVTIQGLVTTLVWPEGTSGMILVETRSGQKYAFSTAKVSDMAKQGFTRFSVHPGEEVIVTGARAANDATIGPGFTAARADLITRSDGNRVFDRARLP